MNPTFTRILNIWTEFRWRWLLVLLSAAVICGWMSWTFLTIYASALTENRVWVERHSVAPDDDIMETLFDEASREKLVRFDPRTFRVETNPCSDRFRSRRADESAEEFDKSKKTLAALCGNTYSIASELEHWNDTLVILAVRDDRYRARTSCDQQPKKSNKPILGYIPAQCFKSPWQSTFLRDNQNWTADTLPISPSDRQFAFFTEGMQAGFNDWTTVRAPFAAGTRVRFETEVAARLFPLTVDLIGTPDAVFIDGRRFDIDPNASSAQFPVAGPKILEVHKICLKKTRRHSVTPMPFCNVASGYRFKFTISPAKSAAIIIEAEKTVFATHPDISNLAVGSLFATPVSEHVQLCCDHTSANAPLQCGLSWQQAKNSRKAADGSQPSVSFSDPNVLLLDDHGNATKEAADAGLLPLVGLDRTDLGSLSEILARQTASYPSPIRLTIDRRFQNTVHGILYRAMNSNRIESSVRQIQSVSLASNPERRASFVIVDASGGPETGAILAVATWPGPKSDLNVWDLAALAQGKESADPLAAAAWRATDAHSRMGSVFKGVTAIAAIQKAIDGDKSVMRALLGASSEAEGNSIYDPLPFNSPLCVPWSCDAGPVSEETLARSFLGPALSGCKDRKGNHIGLCEALATSNNTYFGWLALKLDMVGRALPKSNATFLAPLHVLACTAPPEQSSTPDPSNRAAPAAPSAVTTIGKTAERIFPSQLDLLEPIEAKPAPISRFRIAPVALRVEKPVNRDAKISEIPDDNEHAGQLIRDGFGQTVEGTTLMMATLYASLATEKIVRPYLLDGQSSRAPENGRPLFEHVAKNNTDLYTRLIRELRAGLVAVIRGAKGTAHSQFVSGQSAKPFMRPILLFSDGRDQDRVFAKTGTADTVNNFNTANFAGWIEPDNKKGITRRLAFACSVTHTARGQFGASVCGLLTAEILQAIDDEKAP
jgi:cell division protein FtsI/penicillin-binding protein 2